MPDFTYEALAADGLVLHGEMSARDEQELEEQLRGQGRYLIRMDVPVVRKVEEAPVQKSSKLTDGLVRPPELLAFSEYLWGSTQAGIPILTTLSDLEPQLQSKRLKRITLEIRDAMAHRGKTLSEALAEHPKAFPELYVGTIEAGETTGQLDYALQQMVEFLEWRQEVNLQLKQATTYPVLVVLIMVGLVVVLVTYVYPRLMPVFSNFDIQLPLPTRAVMALGEFVHHYWMVTLGGIVGSLLAIRLWYSTHSGRLTLDTLRLRVPVFGPLVHQIEMARVVTYLALFYRTGVDLIRGLKLIEKITHNRRVAKAVTSAREAIVSGDSLAHAFGAAGLFSPVVIRSLALGEATGKLDESLTRAKKYYEREGPAAVRRMMSALQPLLIVFLGGLLLGIALSIFLPILAIYQGIR